ncbi:MAG: class I fructose-bisphosphate aldolase [Candidatus Nanoarchaeia archaeon]
MKINKNERKSNDDGLLSKIMNDGKCLILAYDQGFEHGPTDFNITNVDPDYIFKIALEGEYSALALQAGIVERYMKPEYKRIPLIIKLNGKTALQRGDPLSLQHTSVSYALKLGASAVGYTIYFGSTHEQIMFKEFSAICEEAHAAGIPVICWMYPRGINVSNEFSTEILAYAARVAMELGADMVKLKNNGDLEAMKWVVNCAGKTKVVIAGGPHVSEQDFVKLTHESLRAGAVGMAVGRNVWQDKTPLALTKALKEVTFNNKTPEEACKNIQ